MDGDQVIDQFKLVLELRTRRMEVEDFIHSAILTPQKSILQLVMVFVPYIEIYGVIFLSAHSENTCIYLNLKYDLNVKHTTSSRSIE